MNIIIHVQMIFMRDEVDPHSHYPSYVLSCAGYKT